jgi:hypothetical protein
MKLCSSKDSRKRAKQQTRQTRLYNNITYMKILILIKLICCDGEKLQVKKIKAVLDFRMFEFHTTHTFVHYKDSPLIRLPCAAFGHSYTADKQTFQAIANSHCLSAKPTLQSFCGLSNIIMCSYSSVYLLPQKKFSKQHITTCPLVLAAVMCSFHLSSHTGPLHFPSESQTESCVS